MKEVNAPKCGRENDLIAFLYDELNDIDTRSFQRHLNDCASCNAELAAFRDVRESVITWRNQSLGIMSSPVSELAAARVGGEKPSAFAAMRAFFNLAPLWMKGAVAFASALFVLFAGLTIANWYNGQRLEAPPTPLVIGPDSNNAYSPEQLTALVEKRVQEKLQKIKGSEQKAAPSSSQFAINQSPRRRVLNQGNESASNQKARRPLSKTEREQLAADLRLISDKTENEFDLLGDRINQ